MDKSTPNTTRDQLLAYAEKLIRTRGCNDFSYRDLAEHVGVKTSSVHYYFPGKDDLLYEAIEAYSTRALAAMRSIDIAQSAQDQLKAYLSMMESRGCGHGELCLGGMLAAEIMSLPDRARGALQGFFRAHEAWLTRVLAQGAKEGSLKFSGTAETAGRAVFATVQGCMLASRLFQEPAALCEAISVLYSVECRDNPSA